MKNKLGIYSKEDLEKIMSEAYMNLHFDEAQLSNPIENIPEAFEDKPELFITYMMSQPDFFSFTCKHVLALDILPFQAVILKELWTRKFPMLIGSRGMSKSFTLAIYVILRLLFSENRKIILCGAAFRQSKVVFGYVESIIQNSSVLRSIFRSDAFQHSADAYMVTLGNSYCKALPIGTGEKIRGQRANDIIADEFSSMLIDIFETVISGFAAVSSSPFQNVRDKAKERISAKLREMGYDIEFEESVDKTGKSDNQIVIAGTAHYDFNHFSQYHKRWLQIIKSRGDERKLKEIFGEKYQKGLDPNHYSVIRIPYELIPEGFMDADQVVRSRATMSENNYLMEFGACFVADSDGFYKNTLLNQCTVDYDMRFVLPSGKQLTEEEYFFEPEIFGNPYKQYVYGIDPASKVDNFSIVILEDCGEYRKIVYCWVTNEKDHQDKRNCGLTDEHNFYAYCARKIRELMKSFPCKRMAIDSQGGGIAVMQTLKDKDKLRPGEIQIYPIIIPGKPQDTDGESGLHIIEPIEFSSQAWTSESNHGMKKDFEDRVLLFPYIDGISMSLADVDEEKELPTDGTLNNVIFNIQELKQELITIIVSETATGREHFDTPEIKTGTGRKGRMKKDRYSALLMANSCARNMAMNQFTPYNFNYGGGFATGGWPQRDKPDPKTLFQGPSWITQQLSDLYN